MSDDAARLRALAAEALELALSMSDPEARRHLWHIALAYQQLAQRAARRSSSVTPGATYGPDALKAITTAFDDAWAIISPAVNIDPDEADGVKLQLANAILSLANEDSTDARVLRDTALQMLAQRWA